MRMMVKGFVLAGALCAVTATARAADGVLIVQTTTSNGVPQTNQIQIESKRMRAESAGAAGVKQIMMFDGVKQVLMIIDPEKKTYSEMT